MCPVQQTEWQRWLLISDATGEAEVTVTAEGRQGTATVTTGTGDLTCLTSLRLT
jgi:hypothetical protein